MLAEALTHHHQTIRVHLISTPMWDGVVLHPMHHLQPHIPGPSTCIIFSPIFHCSQEPCTLQTRHPHHSFISPSPSSPIILPNSTLKYRPPQFLASKLRANPMSCNQALDRGVRPICTLGPCLACSLSSWQLIMQWHTTSPVTCLGGQMPGFLSWRQSSTSFTVCYLRPLASMRTKLAPNEHLIYYKGE